MTAARTIRAIPEDLRRTQVEASDPAVSAWVTANAGSGKTHVLAQRVIRLLLEGVDPAKILCITFTKAAAANMANRVFDELRRWTALDDAVLDAALSPEGALGRALATAIAAASDQTFKDVVGEAIRKRDAVRAWIDHGGSIEAAIASLCGALGVNADDTIERIESEMTEGPLFAASQWAAAAEVLARGAKSDQEQARRLDAALAAIGSERAGIYRQFFLTGKLEPRQQLITRAIEADNPRLAERLCGERKRMLALVGRRNAVVC